MFRYHLVLLSIVLSAGAACGEPPACERLVSRLCGAAGPEACDQLKAHGPTDQKSCQATLDDSAVLSAQLDALVAATAARALGAPPPKAAAE